MKTITVVLGGVTPLMMDRMTGVSEIEMRKLSPRERAEMVAHHGADGNLAIPAEALLQALIGAGKFHKVGKKQITSQSMSLVPATVALDREYLSLGTDQFEVDERSVPTGLGQRILKYRPRLDKWKTEPFSLNFDDIMVANQQFTVETLRKVFDTAGSLMGLLSYRPAKKGPYGRFQVDQWEVQ